MGLAFFITTAGDTDLAIETAKKIIENQDDKINLVFCPLSALAKERLNKQSALTEQITIKTFTHLSEKPADSEDVQQINEFLHAEQVKHAYIGVPSILDNSHVINLAEQIAVPKTIALEYMYHEESHPLWSKIKALTESDCSFVVPTQIAQDEIQTLEPKAKVDTIGHLSISRALQKLLQQEDTSVTESTRSKLLINKDHAYKFISGTSIGAEVDGPFIDALLSELSTGKYENLTLRFGIHPGVKNPDEYLNTLLQICEKHPEAHKQFKIILTPSFVDKLSKDCAINPLHHYILLSEVNGPSAAAAAEGIAQAVPGALVNEAAILGKQAFCFKPVKSYLPSHLLDKELPQFLKAKEDHQHIAFEAPADDCSTTLASNLKVKIRG